MSGLADSRPNLISDPNLGFAGTERFRPLTSLGRGSMGLVYRVYDRETDTEVAVKTLDGRTPGQLYSLKQEFRALAGIVHPNLVQLYELIVTDSESFFTMELVDGVDFVAAGRDAVATSPALAEAGLPGFLDAARQLVLGLATVHAAGKLHRDVKPPNILVNREGRVVLLDFGLATALGVDGARDDEVAGTLAYLAPEQAWGKAPHPAADWYSVGVVFHEALTGRLPFEGPASRVLMRKSQAAPPGPRTLAPAVPERLDALITALLNPDPTRRPGPKEILEALDHSSCRSSKSVGESAAGASTSSARAGGVSKEFSTAMPFVGRTAELAKLHALFHSAHQGRPEVVHILGPSGIGKSELLRRFLSSVEGQAVVLRGRCHPQESVPYNALDTLIDALSRRLLSLRDSEVTALVPEHAAALARLFPVLGRVPALAASGQHRDAAEPQEIRRRGFRALRELLARLAERQPLVLWIDDLQWSDVDSAALLRELLRPPGAPAMLVLLSYRSEDRDNVPVRGKWESGTEESGRSDEIVLGPLDAVDTQELAKQLCAAQMESDRRVGEIVAESAGNPFFVGELARSLSMGEPASEGARSLRLANVMQDRVQQLSATARQLLEVVSLAGGPVSRSVALTAAGIGERGRPVVSTLEQRCLLRTTTVKDQVAIEIYHDRIREALVASLSSDVLQARHAGLADALERQPTPDPEALFRHCLGAGRPARAADWAVHAADHAAKALAFARAAELYREALRLRGPVSDSWPLQSRLAEALANCGRGGPAGEAYELAASELSQRSPNSPEVLTLRRRAAEQYLRVGHLDRGIAATRSALAEVGIVFPATPGRALASVVLQRVRLACQSRRWRSPVLAKNIPAQALLRLEACWGTAVTLTPMDQVVADALGMQHLIESLACGARSHIVRALGVEISKRAQMGRRFRRGKARMLRQLEELVHASSDPYERAWLHFARGASAYEEAAWRTAHEECQAGVKILREGCTGVTWEIVTFESFALSALAHMGELHTLSQRLPPIIADADARGDLYAAVGFRAGVLNLIWLAQDRPDYARQLIDEALTHWPVTARFHVQHYLHLIAAVHAELYVGDGWAAWRRIAAAWPKLRRSLFLALEGPAVELHNLRARAALGAACADRARKRDSTAPDPRWPRARLLRLAARDARWLARRSPASARPFAELVQAGITVAQGKGMDAVPLFAKAAEGFGRVEMNLYRAVACFSEGALCGGTHGAQLQRESAEWMARQGIADPTAMLGVLCPVTRQIGTFS